MDRRIVFPGQLPLETDLLATNRAAMVGLAKLAEACLGTATVANGFSCLPTVPASNSVVVSPGEVYQRTQLEGTPYSSLPIDTRQIVKQGIVLDPTVVTLIPPATVNHSVNILIQVQYAEDDDDDVARPFYNAANPSQPFSGPGNTNTPSPQTRKGLVSIGEKYGAAAITGSHATPTPDAGWIGLFVISLAYGQTQITSGNIIPYAIAPTVLAKLPTIPQAIQRSTWTFCLDTSSTVNVVTINPTPAIGAYETGTEFKVTFANKNTGPVTITASGLASRPLVRRDGSALLPGDLFPGLTASIIDDGTRYKLASFAQGEVPRYLLSPILYVRTDGDDNNRGLANAAGSAFATIGAAIAYATTSFALAAAQLVIVLGIPGTYSAPPAVIASVNNILITSLPDTVTTAQNDYVVQGAGVAGAGGVLNASLGTSLVVRGLTLRNTGTTHHTLVAFSNATVRVEYCTFTNVGGNTASHISSTYGGYITTREGCVVNAGMGALFDVKGGTINQNNPMQLVGTLAFTGATARAVGGRIEAAPGFTGTYTVTGTRYQVSENGVINVNGQGINFLPGSVAGTSTGGLYV